MTADALRTFWWVLGFILVGLALLLCLMPVPPRIDPFDLNDKVAHILGHAALAVYFTGLVERRSWWKIFAFLLVFGVIVELAQHFMQLGRQGDVRDVLGNMAGASFGLLLGWLGLARWPSWIASLLGRRVTE